MGRHDGVPDVLLDARTRRGGAGLWEIDGGADAASHPGHPADRCPHHAGIGVLAVPAPLRWGARRADADTDRSDRKSTRLNSSHVRISYAVFCLKKKKKERKSNYKIKANMHS